MRTFLVLLVSDSVGLESGGGLAGSAYPVVPGGWALIFRCVLVAAVPLHMIISYLRREWLIWKALEEAPFSGVDEREGCDGCGIPHPVYEEDDEKDDGEYLYKDRDVFNDPMDFNYHLQGPDQMNASEPMDFRENDDHRPYHGKLPYDARLYGEYQDDGYFRWIDPMNFDYHSQGPDQLNEEQAMDFRFNNDPLPSPSDADVLRSQKLFIQTHMVPKSVKEVSRNWMMDCGCELPGYDSGSAPVVETRDEERNNGFVSYSHSSLDELLQFGFAQMRKSPKVVHLRPNRLVKW